MNTLKLYRFGRWFYLRRIPVVPRLMERLIFLTSGAFIPMSVEIGEGSVLAYGGMGLLFHADACIGRGVTIAPQVTLGGRCGHGGVPRIEDGCYIGVGAKILGPVRVGARATIGANAVVVTDVPPGAVAAGVPARIVRREGHSHETEAPLAATAALR